jgi:Ala-tRNA(Pro) deacylase
MSISPRLSEYLQQRGTQFELCSHKHSHCSAETARAAHVPAHQVAKSVILEDDQGCVMAVIPADARVNLGELSRILGRNALHLSDENRIAAVFTDCERGAVPAVGMAWGVPTIVDEDLEENHEVYVEAGDHEQLLRMTREQFGELMRGAMHGHFSRSLAH